MTLASFGVSLAALITSTVMSGSGGDGACTAVEYHDDRYQYAVQAQGTCQTSAQRETVLGALLHYADKELPDSICGLHCMRLTLGGDWEGYVVFGAPTYDWDYYLQRCRSVGQYGQCESGGRSMWICLSLVVGTSMVDCAVRG